MYKANFDRKGTIYGHFGFLPSQWTLPIRGVITIKQSNLLIPLIPVMAKKED
jgi:hypothetical protein